MSYKLEIPLVPMNGTANVVLPDTLPIWITNKKLLAIYFQRIIDFLSELFNHFSLITIFTITSNCWIS